MSLVRVHVRKCTHVGKRNHAHVRVRACVRSENNVASRSWFVRDEIFARDFGRRCYADDGLSVLWDDDDTPPPLLTQGGTPLEVGCTNNCLRFTYPSTCANAWIISPQSPLLACHVNLPFRFLQFLVWQLQGFQVTIFRTSSKGWFSPLESIFPFPPLGRSGFAWCRGYSSCH